MKKEIADIIVNRVKRVGGERRKTDVLKCLTPKVLYQLEFASPSTLQRQPFCTRVMEELQKRVFTEVCEKEKLKRRELNSEMPQRQVGLLNKRK